MNCGTSRPVLLLAGLASFFLLAAMAAPVPRTQNYDPAYWFDMSRDLTLSVFAPDHPARRQSNYTEAPAVDYDPVEFATTQDAVEWCVSQGGEVQYYQFGYVSATVKVFGNKKALCNLGQYTLTEVSTLAAEFTTMAQMAYDHPLDKFEWNRTGYGNPSSQYCIQSGGATLSTLWVEAEKSCVGAGWSILPAETSPGIANLCQFADGSVMDAWALWNGQKESKAKRITPHFRSQVVGRKCMR